MGRKKSISRVRTHARARERTKGKVNISCAVRTRRVERGEGERRREAKKTTRGMHVREREGARLPTMEIFRCRSERKKEDEKEFSCLLSCHTCA